MTSDPSARQPGEERCICGHTAARHGRVCYECPCDEFRAAESRLYDAMEQELGEHHWRDGLTFRRLDTGEVRIRRWRKATAGGRWTVEPIAAIPAPEWDSIVREVTASPVVAPPSPPAARAPERIRCQRCGHTHLSRYGDEMVRANECHEYVMRETPWRSHAMLCPCVEFIAPLAADRTAEYAALLREAMIYLDNAAHRAAHYGDQDDAAISLHDRIRATLAATPNSAPTSSSLGVRATLATEAPHG